MMIACQMLLLILLQVLFCVPGVVLRAFLNGTEAAVKRPKMKVTLNTRDLKKFTQEVNTMIKASNLLRSSLPTRGPAQQAAQQLAVPCADSLCR